jgi:hypothetical protein
MIEKLVTVFSPGDGDSTLLRNITNKSTRRLTAKDRHQHSFCALKSGFQTADWHRLKMVRSLFGGRKLEVKKNRVSWLDELSAGRLSVEGAHNFGQTRRSPARVGEWGTATVDSLQRVYAKLSGCKCSLYNRHYNSSDVKLVAVCN